MRFVPMKSKRDEEKNEKSKELCAGCGGDNGIILRGMYGKKYNGL